MPVFRPGPAVASPSLLALSAALLAVSAAACSPLPDLGPAARGNANLPEVQLVPMDKLLAEADATGGAEAALGSLEARLAALRARAAGLRKL